MFSIFTTKGKKPIGATHLSRFYHDIVSGRFESAVESARQTGNKSSLPAVTFSAKFASERRSEAEWKHSGLLVYDFDHVEEAEDMVSHFAGFDDSPVALAFVSPSGRGVKMVMKFHIDGMVESASQHRFCWRWGRKFIEDEFPECVEYLDQSGSDVTRLCYYSHSWASFYNDLAEPLLVDRTEDIEMHKRAMPDGVDEERLLVALSKIPNDDYYEWVRVGMALHDASGGSVEGLRMWKDWSRNGYERYDDDALEHRWGSFVLTDSGVSQASIYMLANKHSVEGLHIDFNLEVGNE